MGRHRDQIGGTRLRRLSKVSEMQFVGRVRQEAPDGDAWLDFLRSHPVVAHELGHLTTKVREDLRLAYPGETREQPIPNADWEDAGYGRVVEMNRLMGLEGL